MAEHVIVRRILLPLGLVSALPALVNFSIILTKETVILSIITVPELTYQVQRMSTETFRFLGLPDLLVPDAAFGAQVNPTTGRKPDLSAALRSALLEGYAPDLEQLPALVPGIDLSLWPSAREVGLA